MGFQSDKASQQQLEYLATYFESVRTMFEDRTKLGSLGESRAKIILLNLQQIVQEFEKTGFEQLGESTDANT